MRADTELMMRGVSVCPSLTNRPQSRMAAVTELCFLLFALINDIQAQELFIIREEGYRYTFDPPKDSDSCLISRFVGEEKLVLWNTSDLWSQNSTLPEDLKQRLYVWNNSSYRIQNLNRSDSGPYQEECWTDGKLTHERNISLIVCRSGGDGGIVSVRLGVTVDIPCRGEADNLDVLWLKQEFRYEEETWSRVFGDSPTSVMDDVKGRYQVVKNTSALRVSNITGTDIGHYTCVKMNQQQQCVSSHRVWYMLHMELIYGSEEESAVLPCDVTDSTDEEPPQWITPRPQTVLGQDNHTEPSVDQNYSLVFSSLMLNHTGQYYCKTSGRSQVYWLFVCPKFGPPAVEFFSEGEDVTLTCKDQEKGEEHVWFIKSNRTEGKIFNVLPGQSRLSRVSWDDVNGTLFISNVSQKDSGEYWCVVIDKAVQCVSTTRYVVQYRGRYRDQYGEPFGVHSTFYKVRCSVLSVLLLMLCVVVVAVNLWARRIKQE